MRQHWVHSAFILWFIVNKTWTCSMNQGKVTETVWCSYKHKCKEKSNKCNILVCTVLIILLPGRSRPLTRDIKKKRRLVHQWIKKENSKKWWAWRGQLLWESMELLPPLNPPTSARPPNTLRVTRSLGSVGRPPGREENKGCDWWKNMLQIFLL